MTDLETRLRGALAEEVGSATPDDLLHDVRRAAARRRARRASGAVALVVGAIVVGSVALQHGRTQHAPEPVKPPSTCAGECPAPLEGRVVDVAAAGNHVFRLTVHDGCTHCSTVSERTPSGDWERIGQMDGGSSEWGPVQRLLMASNGRDGWAWQGQLWSTHDGGRTWRHITRGPGRPTIRGHQVALGTTIAWSVWTGPGGRQQLWRTSIDSDSWKRVRTPQQGDLIGVLSNGWVLLHQTGEGASGAVVVLQGPQEWTHYDQPFTSDYQFEMGGDVMYAPHGGNEVARLVAIPPQDGSIVPAWRPVRHLPPRADAGIAAVDSDRLLVHAAGGWFLVEPGRTVRTDLPGGAELFHVTTESHGTAWATTLSGRVLTSADAVHWTAVPTS
jgi:hypothetical protein